MNISQIIMIVLITMNLSLNLFKHGERKKLITYHFGYALFGESIFVLVLYFGGFWD